MHIYYKAPDVLQEVPASGHVVIEASAGTGKTYTLQHLVVDLLLKDPDCKLDNLLLVTFSRRATAELGHKVRDTLVDVLRAYESQEKTSLPPNENPDNYWRIDAQKAERLREAMLSFDRAQIFTIHAFCQKLLTENAFHNQQLFNLQMVDEEELFDDCVQDVLREQFARQNTLRDWLDAYLHPEVKGSISDLRSNLWEVYSSKSTLIRSSKYPDVIEDPKTIPALLEAHESAVTNAKHGTKKAMNSAYSGLCFGIKVDALNQFIGPVTQELKLRKQRDGLFTYRDMLDLVAESLTKADAGDPASMEFARSVRAQYKYALIDEFQDTDPTQWTIFQKLFVDSPHYEGNAHADGNSSRADTERRIFLIGDPKQAIYKFRGADVWTYLDAVHSIQEMYAAESSDAHTVRLTENFRSTPEMIDAYNEIFRNQSEPNDSFFTNTQISYPDETKVREGNQPEKHKPVKAAPSIVALQIEAEKQTKLDRLRAHWLLWMVDEIDSLLAQKQSHSEEIQQAEIAQTPGCWQKLKASDIFVLTNSNHECRVIGSLLRERGIPFAYYRQNGLFQTLEALDILALLRGIQHPDARAMRRGAYRTPFFAAPIRELEAFDSSPLTAEAAKARLVEWQKLARQRDFHRFFRRILDDSGILLREILLSASERALTNYIHLCEVLSTHAISEGYDLEQLVTWFGQKAEGQEADGDEDDGLQRLETEEDAVQVMTMHKSKGLQAKVVFVYGGFSSRLTGVTTFWDTTNPEDANNNRKLISVVSTSKGYLSDEQYQALHAQEDQDSERLMYTAITRAKSRLYLCYSSNKDAKGREGRHKALARALDRISASGSAPPGLMFVPLELTSAVDDEFPDAAQIAEQEAAEQEALRQKIKTLSEFLPNADTNNNKKDDTPQSRSSQNREPSLSPEEIDNLIPWGTLCKSARKQVSFSGARGYKGDEETIAEELASAAVDFDEADDDPEMREPVEPAPGEEPEPDEEYFADPRFPEATAIAWGGTQFGSFIHNIFEQLDDFSRVLEFSDANAWASAEPTRTIINTLSADFGINPRFGEYNARILFDTLRTPLRLPQTNARLSLAEIARKHQPAHEVDFLFPIPEPGDAFAPGTWPDQPPRLHRGWVDGSIDLVFQHQGRVYIADWKTNQHKTFEHAALASYTDKHYGLQAQLYTLATVRMLGIRNAADYEQKFGGCAYLFVRAMRPDAPAGSGVLWTRPSWETLVGWHQHLAEQPDTRWKLTDKPILVFSTRTPIKGAPAPAHP